MEAYDELASYSSGEDDDYELTDEDDEESSDDPPYEPSQARKEAPVRLHKAASLSSYHENIENKDLLFSSLIRDGEDGKKVTVEQCKDFLRKHGLRVSGTKAVLIERIRGHLKEQEANANVQCEDSNTPCAPVQDTLIDGLKSMKLNNNSPAELPKDINDFTIEDCRAYLRKNGLRLTGAKQVLIERIKEHFQIKDGQGQSKYPEISFSVDCQGDACVGDVVLFSQKVYDSGFNIGGRCAAGPPLGVRTIAGRIVKESYGAVKQQHTFTVEVLWSTGEKALPPLHPLIIKGRNLYRVKTLRQPWSDETTRTKKVKDKHARGAAAREARNARLEKMKSSELCRKTTCKAVNITDKFSREKIVATSLGDVGSTIIPKDIIFSSHNVRVDSSSMNALSACTSLMQQSNVEPLSSSAVLRAGQVVGQMHCTSSQTMSSGPEFLNRNSMFINANRKVNTAPTTALNPMTSLSSSSAISSIELRFNRTLTGLIIGKKGAHCNKVKQISQADLEIDTMNPDICLVRITGTAYQREAASRMIYERVSCRSFTNTGTCPFRETCQFLHFE